MASLHSGRIALMRVANQSCGERPRISRIFERADLQFCFSTDFSDFKGSLRMSRWIGGLYLYGPV